MKAQIGKWVVGACSVVLAACVLGADFNKGRAIAELPLGAESTVERKVDLAEGSADLVIAVRDGRCHAVDKRTTVDVTMTGMGMSIKRSMRLGELTWAYAEGSCDAYGYMYDSVVGLSKKLRVSSGDYQFVIRTRPGPSEESRIGTLWIIYGGRAPTTRMFPPQPAR
jgi:hypothetical protein